MLVTCCHRRVAFLGMSVQKTARSRNKCQNVEHWLSLEDNEPTECDADWHASSAQVRPSKKEVQEVQRKQDDICDAEVALVEKERSTPQDGEAKADVADGIDNPVGLLQSQIAKHLCRPVVKGDIEYSFERIDTGSFVATVFLRALEFQPICGYPELKKVSAKKSAAREALAYFEDVDEIDKIGTASLKLQGGKGVKFEESAKKHNKVQSGGFLEPERESKERRPPLDARPQRQNAGPTSNLKRAKDSRALVKVSSQKPNPVGLLHEKIAAIVRRRVTEEDIFYSFDTAGQRFSCTVSVDLRSLGIGEEVLQGTSEPVGTKREAKILAADAVLSSDMFELHCAQFLTRPEMHTNEFQFISLLHEIVQLLLRRDPTEEDIIYTVEELEESFVATVCVPIMRRLPICRGEVAATRQEAMNLAAEAALISIRDA